MPSTIFVQVLAVVVRLEHVRASIVELIAFGRNVSAGRIVRGRFDQTDPVELAHSRRCHVVPGLASVARQVDQAVIGAGPDRIHVMA